MKSIYVVAAIVLTTIAGLGCKKSNDTPEPYKCTTCKTSPDALAANDASNKGIYKGVFSGSSGTVLFNVQNGGTTITAVLVIDGVTINLTSTVTITSGQAYVAPFTGTLNGQAVTVNFSVGATGQNPTVTSSTVPGHPNASFLIVKETSNALIECFEGTYSTTLPENGTFNLILSRTARVWGASARKANGTATNPASGTLTTDNKLIEANGVNFGTVAADKIDGSFQDGGNRTVTITAKRTL